MLETAVRDGAKKLGLQKKVAETSRVNTDVGTLGRSSDCEISFLLLSVCGGTICASGDSGLLGLDLLVGVVDQILLSRHFGIEVIGKFGVRQKLS